PVGVWLGLASITITSFVFTDETRFPGVAALTPVLGTALVILAGSGQPRVSRTQRILAWMPLSFVGGISYSLYLWHWPLLVIPQAASGLGTPLPLPIRLGLVAAAVLLAFATQRLVERAVSRLRPPRRSRVVPASVVGIAVLAISASVVPGVLLERTPLSAGRPAPATTVAVPPAFTAIVPSNLQPALDAATASTSEAHRNGCHIPDKRGVAVNSCAFGDVDAATRVVLFGDSHAAHWLPALSTWALSHGVRVESYTKVGCASVPVSMSDHGRDYSACSQWRTDVIDRLQHDPPALLVLANTNTLDFVDDGRSREDQWASGIRSLLGELPAATGVLAVANTPELDDDAPVCLSNHLDDTSRCSTSRHKAIDASWIESERAAFESAGADYADLNDYFCTSDLCGPIVGNTLLYRDASHLTEVWSTRLAGVLGSEVDRVLGAARSQP
ncbi:MAG: acyltransferase, partial [Frondihabitans sp.]|nr:acyltransferase [Frondihabitans sp.]